MAKSRKTLTELLAQAKVKSGEESQKRCLISFGPQNGIPETRMSKINGAKKPKRKHPQIKTLHSLDVMIE
ncbi:hypothetical protein XELAEV_18042690mg [Xenopus laevis]|uniref:Uncharacterized protein n=1 Tax=Xenopus laevis TaxID=8355 RepID=A0A974H6L8_XENLA|nr:hypothetical protein XELAEV_18042690mg [Xenopus laevis]